MNPTKIRISEHFLLSDFLGNHSVYTRGYPNMLAEDDIDLPLKMKNIRALCTQVLEPLLEQQGPMTISYGYITPELSDEIVHYQDPRKPSHHMWNLGAAADICLHEFTNGDPDDDSTKTAPIALAHAIHAENYPYSRLITYSESPYLCVAVSADEVKRGGPRKAFYENRYNGVAKAKPLYKSLATDAAKNGAKNLLETMGLVHGWRGAGHPTYHGGGRRQFHHIRTSKYTMLSDWLFDLQSISNGAQNMPKMADTCLWDVFCAAGDAYDMLIDATGINRFSIISAFVSHLNPFFNHNNDWRNGTAMFVVTPPGDMAAQTVIDMVRQTGYTEGTGILFRANPDDTITVFSKA